MKVIAQRWRQFDPALRWALAVYLMSRMLVSVWAAVAVNLAPVQIPYVGEPAYETIHRAYPHSNPVLDSILGVWFRWDTGWFTKVALYGYQPDDGSVTVSPLYPHLIRWFGKLFGGEYLLAALLISNVALIIGLTLLYKLTMLDWPEDMARRAVVYQVAYPAGFFLLAGYTESLFLCLSLLTVYAARRAKWGIVSVAALGASLARMQGWVLAVPLACEALCQARWQPRRAWPGLLAAAAAPLGTASYNIYLALAGLPGMAETYQSKWAVHYAPPWTTVWMAFESLATGRSSLQDMVNTFALVLSLALIAVSVYRFRPSYWLYAAAAQLIFLMGYLGNEQLHSMVRYTLVLFPNMMALALVARGRWIAGLVLTAFLLLQVLLLWMFVRWIWVA